MYIYEYVCVYICVCICLYITNNGVWSVLAYSDSLPSDVTNTDGVVFYLGTGIDDDDENLQMVTVASAEYCYRVCLMLNNGVCKVFRSVFCFSLLLLSSASASLFCFSLLLLSSASLFCFSLLLVPSVCFSVIYDTIRQFLCNIWYNTLVSLFIATIPRLRHVWSPVTRTLYSTRTSPTTYPPAIPVTSTSLLTVSYLYKPLVSWSVRERCVHLLLYYAVFCVL